MVEQSALNKEHERHLRNFLRYATKTGQRRNSKTVQEIKKIIINKLDEDLFMTRKELNECCDIEEC